MKDRKGFTLIELLVVIAIIAVLAAILFPVFAKARKTALAANCASNMKQIGLSIKQYLSDWEDCFPANGTISATGVYTRTPEIELSLDASGEPLVDANSGRLQRFVNGINWIEALYNYADSVTGRDDPGGLWKCQAALSTGMNGSLAPDTACVTYAFNYNLLEQSSGAFYEVANVMMVRECDRFFHAVCRPTVSATGGTGTNVAVYNAFLGSSSADGTGTPSPVLNPKLHGNGSNILFADGHVQNYTLEYFSQTALECPTTGPYPGQYFNYITGDMAYTIAVTPN